MPPRALTFPELLVAFAGTAVGLVGAAALTLRASLPRGPAPDLARAMRVAVQYATLRRHKHIQPEHVVLVAAYAPHVDRAVRKTARAELLALLDRADASDEPPSIAPSLAAATRRALEDATATSRKQITLDDLLRELATPDVYEVSLVAARLLHRAPREEPPRAVPRPADSSPSGPYRTATTVENVAIRVRDRGNASVRDACALFTRAFAVSERDAHDAALELAMTGEARVGWFPFDEAGARAESAAAEARRTGVPLSFEPDD